MAAYRKNDHFRSIPESVYHATDKLPAWFVQWEERAHEQSKGVLYALSHSAFKGLIKVGYTDKPLEETVRRQSNLLPIPEPFKIIDQWEVKDGQAFLRELRKLLKASGYATEKRSFFHVKLQKLDSAIKELRNDANNK